MLTPELELCEVSPTCGADVHKGVCPRNPERQVSHSIGPVGEPVGCDAWDATDCANPKCAKHRPVTADEPVEQAAEVVERVTRWVVPEGWCGGPAGSKAPVEMVRVDDLRAALGERP